MVRSVIVRIVAATILLTLHASLVRAEVPAGITWHRNVSQAYKRAQAESKPLVVYFYDEVLQNEHANLRKFEEEVLASRELAAYRDRAVFVQVDIALDDAQGNAKKLIESLDVKEFPAVAVLECHADQLVTTGQFRGTVEKTKFVTHFRSFIVASMIGIRQAQNAGLTEAEIHPRLVQAWNKVLEANDALTKAIEPYVALNLQLLEKGQFDNRAFAPVAQARNEAHQKLMDAELELAALPTDESKECGQLVLNLAMYELDVCKRAEEDLANLSYGGFLLGYAVGDGQTLVRNAAQEVAAEVDRVKEATDAAFQKLGQRLNKFAAK